MLGESVREARLRKNLTQAHLARLAGVSRRHLAALEKGANVSINILQRVAGVLELSEIQLGATAIHPDAGRGVNVPLLTDTIRQARAEAARAETILAHAESLLGLSEEAQTAAMFPKMPVRMLDAGAAAAGDAVREAPELAGLETAGELRHGQPIDEAKKERVSIPRALVDEGELVFRARGDAMRDHGIEDGDLLVVEPRPRGRAATGELVIGRIGNDVFVGRWWNKHGRRALMANGLSEITSARGLKIVAAINHIIRLR